jgi:nitrate/nitrite transport system ATP-binding protein
MSRYFLEARGLAKRFPQPGNEPLTVFEDVSFGLEQGEFVCIIGHSGCGKSTILNALAGLDSFSEGTLEMAGKEVAGPSLERGVVFQNYSLLPWLTALENVEFGVRARFRDWTREACRAHSSQYLEMVGLGGSEALKPSQLSGGMRQRVSIARAFATQPQLLLLDEPFGALDALTRGVIQDELLKIWSATQQTVFMITHDVDEAILLSDRILLMTNGPQARIAESVRIDLPRPRQRDQVIHHPAYYRIRNHLVDFLVTRSAQLRGQAVANCDGFPPEINPALDASSTARPLPLTPVKELYHG